MAISLDRAKELGTIAQEHAEYTANIDTWTMLHDSYHGTGGFEDGTYLDKYEKEDEAKYISRKKLSYYPNYTAAIVDTYVGHIYKKSPDRRTINDILDSFHRSTNLRGDASIDVLMSQAFITAIVIGHCFVVVDTPNVEVTTKLEERLANKKAYAYVVHPKNVLDWAIDEYGILQWIKIKETALTNTEDVFEEHEERTRYKIWTIDEWSLIEEDEGDLTVIDSGSHGLGKVPVVPVHYKKADGHTILGISGIKDVSSLSKRLFNLLSELDDLLRQQTFAILTFPGDPGEIRLDTDLAVTFDPESKHAPAFIAPPSSTTDSYEKRIKQTVEEIYRLAKLNHTGIENHNAVKSGASLQIEFEKTEAMLQKVAINLTNAEYFIHELVLLWNGVSVDNIKTEVTIEYPDQFGLVDVGAVLEQAYNTIAIQVPSDTFRKHYYRKMSNLLLPEIDNNIKRIIESEIEASEEVVNEVQTDEKPIDGSTFIGTNASLDSATTPEPDTSSETNEEV